MSRGQYALPALRHVVGRAPLVVPGGDLVDEDAAEVEDFGRQQRLAQIGGEHSHLQASKTGKSRARASDSTTSWRCSSGFPRSRTPVVNMMKSRAVSSSGRSASTVSAPATGRVRAGGDPERSTSPNPSS